MGILLILVAQISGWGSLTDSVYPTVPKKISGFWEHSSVQIHIPEIGCDLGWGPLPNRPFTGYPCKGSVLRCRTDAPCYHVGVIFPTVTARGPMITGSPSFQVQQFPITLGSPEPKSTVSSLAPSVTLTVQLREKIPARKAWTGSPHSLDALVAPKANFQSVWEAPSPLLKSTIKTRITGASCPTFEWPNTM